MPFYGQYTGFGGGSAVPSTAWIDILGAAGLAGNCKLLWDIGDPNCYVSGQNIVDVSGGTSYDGFLGATASVTTDDPAYTAAGEASYLQFDGGDICRQDIATQDFNADVASAFHKSGATWSMMIWVYPTQPTGENDIGLCGTSGGTTATTGFCCVIKENLRLNVDIDPSGVGRSLTEDSNTFSPLGEWQLLGLSIDEVNGTDGGFFWKNGAYLQNNGADTWDARYDDTTPDTGPADYAVEMGCVGNAKSSKILLAGGRINMFSLFDTDLSKANMDAIWDAATSRRTAFGL
jgi:hypothetical protein